MNFDVIVNTKFSINDKKSIKSGTTLLKKNPHMDLNII